MTQLKSTNDSLLGFLWKQNEATNIYRRVTRFQQTNNVEMIANFNGT